MSIVSTPESIATLAASASAAFPGRVSRRWMAMAALAIAAALGAAPASAQTRLAVLQAEDRRAPTAADLALLRAASHNADPQIARLGVRALGRLERPALIADILTSLRNASPEVRAEAANAVAQAAQGWKTDPPKTAAAALDSALAALVARLKVEADADVRAALAETIGRIPYATAAQAEKADQTLAERGQAATAVSDRLGAAKGLEALARVSRKLHPLSADAIAALKRLAAPGRPEVTGAARVRRLALEALITATATDEALVQAAAKDPDAQVRRIVMRPASADVVFRALSDESASVRLEAVRLLTVKKDARACAAAAAATADADTNVALMAMDQLAPCAGSPDAMAVLERAVTDLSTAGSPRGWHRAAHALTSLASAAPDRCAAVLPQFTGSAIWQLRMYAARAAATLKNRAALDGLAADADDNVRETAVEGLRRQFAHDADRLYIAQLTQPGYQAVRAGALGLAGSPNRDEAVPALKAALDRLLAEHKDNSHDARKAIAQALSSLGESVKPAATEPFVKAGSVSDLNANDLRRLAAPRARVTMKGVGTFELALIAMEAPATVLRFARLAEAGYYNGLTFHRMVPNFVIQGGSPGANEFVGDSPFMRDEVGLWPHVRGAVGISTRGRDTGDAQLFVDLVDNPRLDHEYTVFAQVLNGVDVIDRVLEGDVIERIEILTRP